MHGWKRAIRKLIPPQALSAYHFALAYLGALIYRFPSRRLIVIGVTGTNGKSSTTEFLNAIFEEAGRKTALSNSIRWKVGETSGASAGRSMPGRFFIQRLLRRAVSAGCSAAIIEMTSEGVKQHRHRAIALDCLVFLNLAPEHIESHGSLEAYADAKFEIGKQLARSPKRPRVMVANAEDAQGARYIALPVERAIGFSVSAANPETDERGGRFRFAGERIGVRIGGDFYIQNALAAAEAAAALGVAPEAIKRGIERLERIPGRMERIEAGQEFDVIVDYALTPDALEALYRTFADKRKICVFGSAGGGRDKWKRPVLGEIAERYCDRVILTNDIAYEEPPEEIIEDIARGMKRAPEKIQDRRLAIRRAMEIAQASPARANVAVLITGMGIDTEISAPDGSKRVWSDGSAAKEEIARALGKV